MQQRKLGSSGVSVSPIIFGAWAIGGWMWGGTDERDSIDAIRASLDAGVNTIDTAAIYGQGYGRPPGQANHHPQHLPPGPPPARVRGEPEAAWNRDDRHLPDPLARPHD